MANQGEDAGEIVIKVRVTLVCPKDDLSTMFSTLRTALPHATLSELLDIPGFRDMGPEAKKAISTRLLRAAGKAIAPGVEAYFETVLDDAAKWITDEIVYVTGL